VDRPRGLLTDHDINWYLTERPPEYRFAVGIGVALALSALAVVGVLLVRENGFVGDSVVTSLDSAGLEQVRQAAPDIRIGQIVTVSIGDFVKLDVDFLSINAGVATPAQLRANRSAGLDTHVWTVNDRDTMERMIERGVNNIITDEPALLRRVIDERAALTDGELPLLALSARLRQ
jgi:glycerophosphoryl diester phosphodiesterase